MTLPKAVLVIQPEAAALRILEQGCAPVVKAGASREELMQALADAEGLLCPAPFPVDSELLDAAPRLRVISNFGVGYNNVDVPDLTRRGIAICNTPGVLSPAVAELTFALMLTAARRLEANADHARNHWGTRPLPPLGFDLNGKTLGIVGLGRIGREVATRAAAFGMKVLFYDLFERAPDGIGAEYRPLDALLAASDIVTLHTNLTGDTHHLIGARELALMKPAAWLVNTSRGPVVDEEALAKALRAGTIAGAALDVLEWEPPAADAPILSAPNTILAPHIGTSTTETRALMLDLCLRNLLAVLGRKRPPECVNPEALDRALAR